MQSVEWCHSVERGVVFVSKCSCEKLSSQFVFNVSGIMSANACFIDHINKWCHADGDIKPCVNTVQT